jgi:hypothetical protein
MLKIKLLIMSLVLASFNPFAQKLSQQEINSINNTVYESLVKENSLVMKRNTSEGEISSCDFEYQYSYRDFFAKQGTTVMVQGSFGFMYVKGKLPGLAFKIQPNVSDVTNTKSPWKVTPPPYSDVFADGKSIKKFLAKEFICETGGICRAYLDTDGSLAQILFEPKNFDIEIKFSLTKGGIDNSFTFSQLISKDKFKAEEASFRTCSNEIFNKVLKDIDQLPKNK